MTLEQLVEEFAQNVAAQNDAIFRGDPDAGNKHADRYYAAFQELRANGDPGRDALAVLLKHPYADVRGAAAACLLRYRTTEAKAVLEGGGARRRPGRFCGGGGAGWMEERHLGAGPTGLTRFVAPKAAALPGGRREVILPDARACRHEAESSHRSRALTNQPRGIVKNSRVHAAILALNAAAFIFFGLRWLFDPLGMSQPLGITLTNADAVTDAQAVYGGLELGVGLFLAYCGLRPPLRHIGLVAATLALGGLGLSRLAGILAVAGPITNATRQLLATDLFGAVLNATFCIAAGRSAATQAERPPAQAGQASQRLP